MQAVPQKENEEARVENIDSETKQAAKLPSPEKKQDIAKLPPIDITNLDLEQLRPVGKEDYELGPTKVCVSRLEDFLSVIPACHCHYPITAFLFPENTSRVSSFSRIKLAISTSQVSRAERTLS